MDLLFDNFNDDIDLAFLKAFLLSDFRNEDLIFENAFINISLRDNFGEVKNFFYNANFNLEKHDVSNIIFSFNNDCPFRMYNDSISNHLSDFMQNLKKLKEYIVTVPENNLEIEVNFNIDNNFGNKYLLTNLYFESETKNFFIKNFHFDRF